jgi:secondary thiamine-phosphate synthase enzyme
MVFQRFGIMSVRTKELSFSTRGGDHIIDITEDVGRLVSKSKIKEGIVTVFVPGSTGAITTIEYEPGLLKDVPDALERLFPKNMTYGHDQTWHDGNGHSHVRAAFLGPSLTVPISKGGLTLGTWQQIVFVELDNRSRNRKLIVKIMGE